MQQKSTEDRLPSVLPGSGDTKGCGQDLSTAFLYDSRIIQPEHTKPKGAQAPVFALWFDED